MNDSINFLSINQQNDGSFLSLTSSSPSSFIKAVESQTVFSTALVLSCLNVINEDNQQLDTVKRNAAQFLLSQKSEQWSFNYWVRGCKQAMEMPYPDDLDDTACALAAICEYNPELIDGEALAGIVTVLTALESKEGGPYKTWLVPPTAQKAWLDVDLAVNSNIGYFLSLQDVKLKNIIKLIEVAIDDNKYESPYYPHSYPIIYFISRFYKGKKRSEIINYLLKKQKDDNWGNPLDTAFAILSLINFGLPVNELTESINYLIKNKKEDGSWLPQVIYVEASPNQSKGDNDIYYAGSSALTTAFCVAAIYRASVVNNLKQNKKLIKSITNKNEDIIFQKITQKAKESFSTLGVDLRTQTETFLKKILKNNKDRQIVLLPYLFMLALGKKMSPIQESKVLDLGLANLYGWMAYTIYDDFLDDEGDVQMLSVANVCMREADRIFLNISLGPEFSKFVATVFNRIDSSNAWEVAHCRVKTKNIFSALTHPLPDFNNLASLSDRSLGHAIGPVAVLYMLGYKIGSKENCAVLEGFRLYIAAKQIHDDMHDWEDDLARGQINSASATLFSAIENHKLFPKEEKNALQFLQNKFWEESVVVLCERVFLHLEHARRLFLSSGVSHDFIDRILTPLLLSTELTLRERKDAKKFIAKYTSKK